MDDITTTERIKYNIPDGIVFEFVDEEGEDEQRELELAYAMTVHKSQGCEYPCVVLLMHSAFYSKLLRRNLLYTAMTRASKYLFVFSDEESLTKVPLRTQGDERITDLVGRLQCNVESFVTEF